MSAKRVTPEEQFAMECAESAVKVAQDVDRVTDRYADCDCQCCGPRWCEANGSDAAATSPACTTQTAAWSP